MKLFIFFLTSGLCFFVMAETKSPKQAEKPKTNFFVLFDDECEHPTSACTVKNELPKTMKKNKDYLSVKNYIGSVLISSADENEARINAWEHYFSDKNSCEKARKKFNAVCEG